MYVRLNFTSEWLKKDKFVIIIARISICLTKTFTRRYSYVVKSSVTKVESRWKYDGYTQLTMNIFTFYSVDFNCKFLR